MEKVQPVLAEKYKMKQGKISSLTLSGGGWGWEGGAFMFHVPKISRFAVLISFMVV